MIRPLRRADEPAILCHGKRLQPSGRRRLYTARSLSYDDVEYELVEHQLTPEQTGIYDAYAGAFAVIHNNLNAAMQAANITGDDGTLNRQAKVRRPLQPSNPPSSASSAIC
ncbi:strawberry notch-like NTP hydrolase domain-containing protein [Castellaniella sp.]|uniref:strawberry notch-like NTP hydrolase domain-containing protein n=1 Tax=Castellaniella sp. TaxID=1955812 RepID=UPI002AFFFF45|nr:hypothetical protein [Castellaniella sp.]